MLKKVANVESFELPLKIKPQKSGGFVVTSPVWSDCYAQGDSLDEAILEVTAVAQSLIELYKEEGLKIPLKLTKKEGVSNPVYIPVVVSA